ncbi:M67 family metallopeptidase [Sphingobium sp. DEHP117]|uniref:Mov34/MPN/PAD-1 family protein n=1 Tax=Sphingobium sp. DEHP117 TaxID=2993436 RepID=UPI0027D71872|nr:Mov34/MPN/PAD-1 family protein [Sphingobium sp. DEHP117]MDQ4419909.1 M67 family metallopeptidase [Sphingobium sp. DEHP117]
MTVHISRAALERVLAHAAAHPGQEVCGLLLGGEARIEETQPAANVAQDAARRFELDPTALIAAHRAARAGGPSVIGHYHSHPGGDVEPSSCDAAEAPADRALWLICAPDGGHALWREGTGGLHGRFTLCALEVCEP